MHAAFTDLTAFILAGGKSTRMGADKAFVELDGRTLLARALDVARSLTPDVRIVGDSAKFASFAPVVEDLFRNCGPLAGIHAALQSSQSDLNLILAVDLPFIPSPLLRFLVTRAKDSATSLVTIPRTPEGWQPLCAVYRKQFADAAEHALRAGRYKIGQLFHPVQTQAIDAAELEAAGFSQSVFRNLNTPQELAEARKTANPQ
jgi:molybdopterin-guanine dinucleotide biosynthesis protein A